MAKQESENTYGLSQKGANRWARGNRCGVALPGELWSVRWTTAEQILFHYFTRVHLRDANIGKLILSPDWRWNPLLINWGTTDNQPPKMNAGSTSSYAVLLQNTGIYPWTCIKGQSKPIPPPSYRLRYRWLNGRSIIATGYGTPVCDLSPGDSSKVELVISVPAVPVGTYTLRLDMYEDSAGFWFGDGGWPPYDVNVQIVTPPSPTPTPTSCGNDC